MTMQEREALVYAAALLRSEAKCMSQFPECVEVLDGKAKVLENLLARAGAEQEIRNEHY